jgi:hypothetical protein
LIALLRGEGPERAARVLTALGITELDPPTPPATAATIV